MHDDTDEPEITRIPVDWRDSDGVPWLVTVEFTPVDGEQRWTSVRIEGPSLPDEPPPALTTRLVRSIPLQRLVRAAQPWQGFAGVLGESMALHMQRAAVQAGEYILLPPLAGADQDAPKSSGGQNTGGRPRRSRELLATVAFVYMDTRKHPHDALKAWGTKSAKAAVREWGGRHRKLEHPDGPPGVWAVPDSTAADWIRAARTDGHLD